MTNNDFRRNADDLADTLGLNPSNDDRTIIECYQRKVYKNGLGDGMETMFKKFKYFVEQGKCELKPFQG